MDDEAEVYKMWRIRKTVMSLCHDRGYLVSRHGKYQDDVTFRFDIGKPGIIYWNWRKIPPFKDRRVYK